jgi:hypothetical protein
MTAIGQVGLEHEAVEGGERIRQHLLIRHSERFPAVLSHQLVTQHVGFRGTLFAVARPVHLD